PQGSGAAGGRLGTTRDLLSVPARALGAPPHDQHRGVSVCYSAAADNGGQALQESREYHSAVLEAVAGGRVYLSPVQGSRVTPCCVHRYPVRGGDATVRAFSAAAGGMRWTLAIRYSVQGE